MVDKRASCCTSLAQPALEEGTPRTRGVGTRAASDSHAALQLRRHLSVREAGARPSWGDLAVATSMGDGLTWPPSVEVGASVPEDNAPLPTLHSPHHHPCPPSPRPPRLGRCLRSYAVVPPGRLTRSGKGLSFLHPFPSFAALGEGCLLVPERNGCVSQRAFVFRLCAVAVICLSEGTAL